MRRTDTIPIEEIKGLISSLKQNPITEMWSSQEKGHCTVQRVEASQVNGRCSLLNKNTDGSEDQYQKQINGVIGIHVGRMPNACWFEESGATYLVWKEKSNH